MAIEGPKKAVVSSVPSAGAKEPAAEVPKPKPTVFDVPVSKTGLEPKVQARIGAEVAAQSQIDARKVDPYARHRKGEVPIDAEAYAAITGISVSDAKAAELDALVKSIAERIGLEHEVRFARETKYAGRFFEMSFVGTFEAWNQPEKPILIGLGILARTRDDMNILYKHFQGDLPSGLLPYIDSFLALPLEDRIEAVLVHEKHELEAGSYSSKPHRTAVEEGPKTPYEISPRARESLKLYAEVDRRVFGEFPR